MYLLYYCYGHNVRNDPIINELNKVREWNFLPWFDMSCISHDVSLYHDSIISGYIGNSNSPMHHCKGTLTIQNYNHYNYII